MFPHRLTSFFVPMLACALLAGISSFGCRAQYPSCETDKDCHEKEFCVDRKCQQCRQASDCGEGQTCNAGKCEKIAGYCRDASQCPAGQACIANRCRPCAEDKQCPSGTACIKGVCTAKKACTKDDDCAQNEDCVDGKCVAAAPPAPPPTECTAEPVYFDFNESALTTAATDALVRDAECLKKVRRAVTLVGHADPRGTEEYNLALSERRAQSVKAHLGRLGVDEGKLGTLPRGALDAKGTDEPGWAKDRRVDFAWK